MTTARASLIQDAQRHAPRGDTLVQLSSDEANAFGTRPLVTGHRLDQHPLFEWDTLAELIDNYPRDRMQAFTMGADVRTPDEWKPVEVGKLSSNEILEAVRRGRIWFKLLQLHVVDRRFRELLDQLYAEISARKPSFKPVRTYGTLLISSPSALVYFHADAQPNMLWHIRGTKRIWVYPAGDRELISQELMEDIFAAYVDEEAPYDSGFDRKALVFDLHPGEVISWPQNSPHRVTNLEGVNVSLSTLHETPESDRRKLVYCANRLLHRSYGLPARSVNETGLLPSWKRTTYRAWRKLGWVDMPPRRAYITDLLIDPAAPSGISNVESGLMLTEFSRKDFIMQKDASGKVVAIPRDVA